MSKRPRKPKKEDRATESDTILQFKDTAPIDPDEFAFAFNLGVAATTYRMPMKSPREYKLNIKSDGEMRSVQFADIPMNRMAFAIREHCGDDYDKFKSILARNIALIHVVRSDKAKSWMRIGPEAREIHPAVVEAAAVMPLDEKGEFDEGPFFKEVAEIALRMEAE